MRTIHLYRAARDYFVDGIYQYFGHFLSERDEQRTPDSLEKNGHSICLWRESPQGGISLRRM
jgi:hypothetical protein